MIIKQFCKKSVVNICVPIILLAFLASCGGGGSSGTTTVGSTPPPTSSSITSGVFLGPIAGIGSIVVNGIRFETVGVSVEDTDDIYGSTSFNNSLSLGMTVALGGDVDETALTGTPNKIRVIGGVRGMVSAKTLSTISTLNGQTVNVDSNTVFAGLRANLASIVVNDYVEIYGVTSANGDFLATRVVTSAALTTTNKLAIRGTIDSIPSANNYVVRTSSTSTVSVICATPSCLIRPSNATLTAASGGVPGTPVRIVAADSNSLNAGKLTAVMIQSLSPQQLSAFTGVTPSYTKIKGFATLVGSDWYVAGVKVTGATLTAGQYVEVKGTLTGNVMQAIKVSTDQDRAISGVPYKNEFYGSVTAKSGNTFVVQGITVDATSATITGGTLAAINVGNYVEVKGTLTSGVLNAIQVDIKTANTTPTNGVFAGAMFEVYGTVSNWTNSSNTFTLTSLGSPVVTYTALASNATISGTITNTSVVEGKGYLNANQQLVISKLEVKPVGFKD